jgi:hypothetical protein
MSIKRPARARAVPIRDLLTGNAAVAQALASQRRDDALLCRVRDLLAPGARAHCIQAANVDGTLKLTVDSAVWATRLRYLAPELAQALAVIGITAVQVRASPRAHQPARQTPRRVDRLTPMVVDHLLDAADHMADAGIAEVFRRLAARHREG